MRNVWGHTDISDFCLQSSLRHCSGDTLEGTGLFSEEKNLFSRRLHSFAPHLMSLTCRRNNWDIKESSFVIFMFLWKCFEGRFGTHSFSCPGWVGKPCGHVFRTDPLPTPEQKPHRIEAKPRGGPPQSTHATPPLHQMHFLGGCTTFPRLLAADKCVLFSFLTRVLQIHLNGGGGHSLVGPLTLWKEEKPLKC